MLSLARRSNVRRGRGNVIKQAAVLALTLSIAAACSGGNEGAQAGPAPAGNAAAPAPDQRPGNAAATASAPRETALALSSEGLQAVDAGSGRTSMIAFGRPVGEAVAAVSRITGERPTDDSVNEECGAGPTRIIRFGDGLHLLAQEDRFAGWSVDQAGHTTMDGIGVGTTRAALSEAQPRVEPSTLGTEWTIGEVEKAIGGLLSDDSPSGRVTLLWAGLTCHFR